MGKKLRHGRPPAIVFVQARGDEAPELRRRRAVGQRRRLDEADGAHERRPVRLLPGGEQGVAAHEELQDSDPEAPHVGGAGVVVPAVRLRVEALRAHVRGGAHVRRAVIAGVGEHPGDAEVGDLDLPGRGGEEVRGLDVEVHDAAGVEVGQPGQRLRRHLRERRLRERSAPGPDRVERPAVRQLKEQGHVAGAGRRQDRVAPDDERRGGPAQDFGLGGGGGVALVQDLERVERARLAVPHLVHGAAVPAAQDGEPVEVGEAELARPGERCRGGLRRGHHRRRVGVPEGRLLDGRTGRDVQREVEWRKPLRSCQSHDRA